MNKAEFMKLISQHWDEVEQLEKSKTFYELEENVYKIVQRIGRELLESSMQVRKSEDRRKKNPNQQIWTS